MIKIFFIILVLFLLNNCAAPGTALLSPAITGVKTKSAHQASLSLASSLSSKKIIENLKEAKDSLFLKQKKNNFLLTKNPKIPKAPYVDKDPKILLAYIVDKIEISDVYEPEPLP
jgi:hypothetical protein